MSLYIDSLMKQGKKTDDQNMIKQAKSLAAMIKDKMTA